ncbi:acylneuraminate cytidylyltransferase family protein [Blastopirellula sp. J2-11]|uniref:acylneuraminate cytidylyltransferase family protein n=1 Tax=Blastopirellula sp. J2-11 TaxID=2943192 RepID=UPI0021C9651E|nr:acylneuraminate cytidylyltransferase family protein [Blastopirellula sp. J2-11]UUO04581.1 acylneuraminate cytidylyltransferase family protein [Blastopirellula sp. J2-11]
MSRTLFAVIPVRSGSIRIPHKNTRPFCGSSLLEVRVRQMLNVQGLDGVCVSSNDPEMLEIAKTLGAKVHARDPYYATDTIPMSEVYAHMAREIECDDILHTTVTSPLVTTTSYEHAIRLYRDLPDGYDSLTTVADVKEFLLRDGVPLNYDNQSIPRSQDLPDITRLTFAASILPREMMVKNKSNLGLHPYLLKLSHLESLDIDTPLDFLIAEWLFQKTVIEKQSMSDLLE